MDTPDGVGHCRDQNAREAGEPFSETLADTDMWGSGLAQSGAARPGTALVRRQRNMGRCPPVTEHLHRMGIRTAGTWPARMPGRLRKKSAWLSRKPPANVAGRYASIWSMSSHQTGDLLLAEFGKRLLDLEPIKEMVAAYAARPARSCGCSRPCASASESASASACLIPLQLDLLVVFDVIRLSFCFVAHFARSR